MKRLESESDNDDEGPSKRAKAQHIQANIVVKRAPSVLVKPVKEKPVASAEPVSAPAGLGGLLGDYGSESD